MITKQPKNYWLLLIAIFFVFSVTLKAEDTKKPCCTKHETTDHCATEKDTGVNEVESLHKLVSQLWHKDFPALNLTNMKRDVNEIIDFMPTMQKIKIKDQSRNEQLSAKIIKLNNSLNDLKEYLEGLSKAYKTDDKLKNKVVELHNNFHAISELF